LVLTLILAESSVELVPNEIAHHPAIIASARRKQREPSDLILDQSYHHAAIIRLRNAGAGRGRPDIVHFSLLTALGSPLNAQRELQCFVHTRDDHVITIDSRARLPRNTDRFTSLLEKLYQDSVVPSTGASLMSLSNQTLQTLIERQRLDQVVALSTQGIDKPLEQVADELQHFKKPAVLVGGFPDGHFSHETVKLSEKTYRIDKRRLDAWTVVGRTIYDYEKSIGLKRF
jgi:rRNA small subunit pseudouridine methyltransferase Nep1